MAYNPNDPYRAGLSDDEIRRQARLSSLDNEIQPDPELAEGPASGAKVAMFAIAVAVPKYEQLATHPNGAPLGLSVAIWRISPWISAT